ncbi:hypothetical protein HGRIS_010507 [Hohenbuehelia grisea]|uniref:Uncharacterized protein n=1 Tax=Hohenbuehelia grisea TaxID=104357 RepID=A0ABR3IX30_9AGAR
MGEGILFFIAGAGAATWKCHAERKRRREGYAPDSAPHQAAPSAPLVSGQKQRPPLPPSEPTGWEADRTRLVNSTLAKNRAARETVSLSSPQSHVIPQQPEMAISQSPRSDSAVSEKNTD